MREKEREKFRLYRATKDPKLREEIIDAYRPLAEHIARQFLDSGEPLEDLVQVALIGLIKAIDSYDPERGTGFSTFAWYHIRGEITHYLRDYGKLIAEPAWLQEARIKVERVRHRLRQTLRREPTEEEVAEATGLKPDVVRQVLMTEGVFQTVSLDEAVEGDEEGVVELDRFAVNQDISELERRYFIRRAVEKLPELQRKVIEMMFWEDLSQTEIARLLGVSVTYVSYLFRRAKENLRRLLTGEETKEEPQRRPKQKGRKKRKGG